MINKAPLPASAARPAAEDNTRMIVAGIAVAAAVLIACFLPADKTPGLVTPFAAAIALAVIAAAFGVVFLFSGNAAEAEAPVGGDAKADILRMLEENRKETGARIADLKKSLDAAKATAVSPDAELLSEEISKLRAEIAGLRSTLNRR